MVSGSAEFSEGTVGMAGLCSAMSGASDQRLEGGRARSMESLTRAGGYTSKVALTWGQHGTGRVDSAKGCVSVLVTPQLSFPRVDSPRV